MLDGSFYFRLLVIAFIFYFLTCLAFMFFEQDSFSCSPAFSAFGAAQDKGDMRVILVCAPSS